MEIKKLHESNELQDRSKKHKKNNKGLSFYCTLNPDAGNVEHNVAMFNHMNTPAESPSVNPCGPMAEDINTDGVSHLFKLHVGDIVEYEGKEFTVDAIRNDPEHTELVPSMLKLGDEWVPEEWVALNYNHNLREESKMDPQIELNYTDLEVTIVTRPRRPSSYHFEYDRDEAQTVEEKIDYEFVVPRSDVVDFIYENMTENDFADIDTAPEAEVLEFINKNFDSLFAKYESMILDTYRDQARADAEEHMNESLTTKQLGEATCGVEKFVASLGKDLHEAFLNKVIDANTTEELQRLEALHGKYSKAHDDSHTSRIVEKVRSAIASCADNKLTESFNQYVIMAVCNDGKKQYYNVSSAPHWVDNGKDATIFDDMDEARAVWFKLDKKPFKRVFIPNYDHAAMNEAVDLDKQYQLDMLSDRIEDVMDWKLNKKCKTRPLGNSTYRVIHTSGNTSVVVRFDISDPSTPMTFMIDKKGPFTAKTEDEAANIILRELQTKHSDSFDMFKNEDLSDRIRKNDLEFDDSIDAWHASEDGTEIQLQDRETHTHEFRTAENQWGRSYVAGQYNKQPKVATNTWGRVWKDGELVKQFEGPKYKVRADMAKYLDADGKLDESKVPDNWTQYKGAWMYPVYGGWEANLDGLHYDAETEAELKAKIDSAVRGGYTKDNKLAGLHKDADKLPAYGGMLDEIWNPDYIDCPICGDISFDPKRGRCTQCAYREELNEANYGGAYDIDPEQYFTRDDLVEFADEVVSCIAAREDALFDVCELYIEGNNITIGLNNEQRNGDFEHYVKFRVDMRKIRYPHDLSKYVSQVADEFIKEYKAQCAEELDESLEDSAFDWEYKTADGRWIIRQAEKDHRTPKKLTRAQAQEIADFRGYKDGELRPLKESTDNEYNYKGYTIVFANNGECSVICPKGSHLRGNMSDGEAREFVDSLTESFLDDDDNYEFISRKSVLDSDGFYTDYTWYKNLDGLNVFVFGDSDIYKPADGYIDHEEEDDSAAQEWFDSYNGFEEDIVDESLQEGVRYPNGEPVTDIDLNKALDYMYGTDRNPEWTYTDDEMQRAVYRWMDKVDPRPDGKSYMSLQESYNIKFYQIFEAPKKPTENGKMIGQRDSLSAAIDFGEDRVGKGNFIIKGVCDDGRTRYVDFYRKDRGYAPFAKYEEDVNLTEGYNVKFYQVFRAPQRPTELGKMIAQAGTAEEAKSKGEKLCGPGNYFIKGVCDDGKVRYLESWDSDSDEAVYTASSIESLNNYCSGLGDACRNLRDGNMCSFRGYEVELVNGEYSVYLLEQMKLSESVEDNFYYVVYDNDKLLMDHVWSVSDALEFIHANGGNIIKIVENGTETVIWKDGKAVGTGFIGKGIAADGSNVYCQDGEDVPTHAAPKPFSAFNWMYGESLTEDNKPLYIIKDSKGNQLSAPNSDDEALWDRVASMEARGRRGLCVVAYTGKNLKEWNEFSDDDVEDDLIHAAVYGGDSKYCAVCGAVKQYDEDGFAFCPECDSLEESYWYNDPSLRAKQDELINQLEADGFQETDGRSHGSKHWTFFRKMVDGKGVWKAIFVDTASEEAAIVDVTYGQARGYEPLDGIDALRRGLGRALLPN